MTEKQTSQIRHDFEKLRSSSPAIKRPASDMGAQDREEHSADVDMDRESSPLQGAGQFEGQDNWAGSTPKAKQVDTGSRHLRSSSGEIISQTSNPKASGETISSETDSISVKSGLVLHSDTSTAATTLSNTSIHSENLPSIDEQVQKVRTLASQELQDGQKGFLVSAKWLNRVVAKSSIHVEGVKIDKSAELEEIGPIDNSDLTMVMDGAGELKDEIGEPFIPLRLGLQMGDDYQILPQEAWDLIVQWYTIAPNSPIMTRFAHNTTDQGNCEYELNPPIFTFLKVPSGHTLQTQKDTNTQPPKLLATRSMGVQKWLKNAKSLVNIDMTDKVRVWKYLGGLKGNALGMLTPAASRSASPAPGAELVATAGDRMLLDVVAFSALSDGDERELVDIQDQTENSKYNGNSTLQLVGLGRSDVIILEERISSPGGGEWPSESVKSRVGGKRDIVTSKGKPAAVNGRSSPAPATGIMTRGRQRRDPRPKGITGLNNIGNTCYMNSALQCIRSVEELTMYFLHDDFKHDLNASNPLSHNGQVANAYGLLLKKMYDENISSFSPSAFKSVIGKYGPNFSGYGQQDSQEFLLFLLDGLAEDLSRIQKKPYIEKPDSTDEMVYDHAALKAFADKNWEIYKARNDSVVTDLFSGMYKSTVTCPVCHKVSIIFDPFNSLTLQLPIENNWTREIWYFPYQKAPIAIDIDIDKNASTFQLKEFIARRVNADASMMVVAELYHNRFYKMFDDNLLISEYSLQTQDQLGVFELDAIPTNYNAKRPKRYSSGISFMSRDPDDMAPDVNSPKADRLLVPVFHRLNKISGRHSRSFFGEASFVVLDRNDQKDYRRILRKLLGNVSAMTTKDIFEDEVDISTSAPTPEDSDLVITTDDEHSSDSNNVHANSVESEDGLVDVSMDGEQIELSKKEGDPGPAEHPALRREILIPRELLNDDGSSKLFDIKVSASNHAVPLGWNEVDESKDYTSIFDLIPKVVTHRPARRHLSKVDGATSDSSNSSEDIPHDAPGSEGNSSGDDLPDDIAELAANTKNKKRKQLTYASKDRKKTLDASQSLEPQSLVRPGEAIILDWNLGDYESCFEGDPTDSDGLKGSPTWGKQTIPKLHDPELTAKREKRQSRKKNGISLEDCLNETGKSETLSENNAWYCPRCKEHRRADKKLELWKIPDILVMHLKRFSSNRSFRDKLEVFVDYPVEGLNMTDRVIEHEPRQCMIYDLIAVDMHYGGLGGGHYTAYAQNFINKSWYEYNDNSVSLKSNPQQVVTGAAYLLFYRRREPRPLGGPILAKILEAINTTTDAEEGRPQGSREPSPHSGEGRRLDGSSHNGSSSAYLAGQAHHVGDGGLAITKLMKAKGMTGAPPEDGNRLRSVEMRSLDEELPAYSPAKSNGSLQHFRTHMGEGFDPDEDEAIDTSMDPPGYGPPVPWNSSVNGPGWSFDKIGRMGAAPPASPDPDAGEVESFHDSASTKTEGGNDSVPHSPITWVASDEEVDTQVHDLLGNTAGPVRGKRESAPPPEDMEVDFIVPPGVEDEDDELPIVELRTEHP